MHVMNSQRMCSKQHQNNSKTCYNGSVASNHTQSYGRVAQLVRAHPLQATAAEHARFSLVTPRIFPNKSYFSNRYVLQATAGGAA